MSDAADGLRSCGWGRGEEYAEVDDVDEGIVEALGWLDVWTLACMVFALGSFSQAKREPKGKCCTTGNLERTSALYILIMPFDKVSVPRSLVQ